MDWSLYASPFPRVVSRRVSRHRWSSRSPPMGHQPHRRPVAPRPGRNYAATGEMPRHSGRNGLPRVAAGGPTSRRCERAWVGRCRSAHRCRRPVLAAGPVQGVEVLGVGVGEGVEVLLGGGDLGVAHPVHDGLEVGAAGEEPGGVGVAEVVDADVEVDSPRSASSPTPSDSAPGSCNRSIVRGAHAIESSGTVRWRLSGAVRRRAGSSCSADDVQAGAHNGAATAAPTARGHLWLCGSRRSPAADAIGRTLWSDQVAVHGLPRAR